MLRKGGWKYHEYVEYEPELFDVDSDPDETMNRADDSSCSEIVGELRRELRWIVDPAAADRSSGLAGARPHSEWERRARRPRRARDLGGAQRSFCAISRMSLRSTASENFS
jgi:arylsulfatase A-like enzyme